MKQHTFRKGERLCSKTLFEALFTDGESFANFPFRMVYRVTELSEEVPAQIAFSVSKKRFKKAVDRNRVKRLMREAYRQHKSIHYDYLEQQQQQVAMLIIFTGKEEPTYRDTEKKIIRLLKRFIDEHQDRS